MLQSQFSKHQITTKVR